MMTPPKFKPLAIYAPVVTCNVLVDPERIGGFLDI
jgi:hypothetical protein